MQAQQEHVCRDLHPDSASRQPECHYHDPGQESTVFRPPAQDQEAHRGQQEYHAAHVQQTATRTEPTVRDNHRKLLQHEHMRNGKSDGNVDLPD